MTLSFSDAIRTAHGVAIPGVSLPDAHQDLMTHGAGSPVWLPLESDTMVTMTTEGDTLRQIGVSGPFGWYTYKLWCRPGYPIPWGYTIEDNRIGCEVYDALACYQTPETAVRAAIRYIRESIEDNAGEAIKSTYLTYVYPDSPRLPRTAIKALANPSRYDVRDRALALLALSHESAFYRENRNMDVAGIIRWLEREITK